MKSASPEKFPLGVTASRLIRIPPPGVAPKTLTEHIEDAASQLALAEKGVTGAAGAAAVIETHCWVPLLLNPEIA